MSTCVILLSDLLYKCIMRPFLFFEAEKSQFQVLISGLTSLVELIIELSPSFRKSCHAVCLHGCSWSLAKQRPCVGGESSAISFTSVSSWSCRDNRTSPSLFVVIHLMLAHIIHFIILFFSTSHSQMDFPVEATVLLNKFPDETRVRAVLRSHGFELRDLSRDEVSIKGSFLKLKDAKASLELLLRSQTKRDTAPSLPPPVLAASSRAISKYYTSNSSDRNRSRPGSRKQASPTTTTTTTTSSSSNHHPTPAYSPRPDQQRGSFRSVQESLVIDPDVFKYAEKLRRKDIDCILERHNVGIEVHPVGESCSITLHGESAKPAAFKLQSLLLDLSDSLRTQEVSRRDMDREGRDLFRTIQNDGNVWNLVLVCQKDGELHLIGPSRESYDLKQRLLRRPIDNSGQRGRTSDRRSRGRSSSLPPNNRRNRERESVGAAYPSPAGAAGYNPSKYQDVKPEGAESKQGAVAVMKTFFRGRSSSESRQKNRAERTNGNAQETEKRSSTQKSPKKVMKPLLLQADNIKKKFKSIRKSAVNESSRWSWSLWLIFVFLTTLCV